MPDWNKSEERLLNYLERKTADTSELQAAKVISQLRTTITDKDARIAELEFIADQRAMQIEDQQAQITHLEMALADTEALEIGTGEVLERARERIAQLEDALRASRDAFQNYVDEHEECTDADDWMAMMCSMEAHHATDEAIAKINELIGE